MPQPDHADGRSKRQGAPITIAMLALGGEGGGVLADWIVDLAQHGGYLAQATSVPGVAQRTGATIYYSSCSPRAPRRRRARPVLALMPVPGDVDIVIASELMEAGARGPARLRHAGQDPAHRLDPPRLRHDREDRARRWPGGRGGAAGGLPRRRARARGLRHGGAGGRDRQRDERGAVRRAGRLGRPALPAHGFEAAIRRGQVGVNTSLAAFGAGSRRRSAGACPSWRREQAARVSPGRNERPRRRRRRAAAHYQDAATRRFSRAAQADPGNERHTATAPAGCWRRPRASSRWRWPMRTRSAWRS